MSEIFTTLPPTYVELFIPPEVIALAKIKYKTKFKVFELQTHLLRLLEANLRKNYTESIDFQ